MSRRRIKLSFEHSTLCGVGTVDIYVPLPEPIVESIERIAARVCPTCPICKQPMQYVGFLFENADDREELNRPFPGQQPQESVGVEALRQYAKQREYIQAIRWAGEVTPAVAALLGSRPVVIATTTRSLSLGNGWYADVGDWITSADGEKIVVIDDDVFRHVYEEVPQDQPNEARLVYPRGYGTAVETLSFRVCAACAAMPGPPTLCEACFRNRGLIHRLRHALDELFHLADRLCTQNWPASETPRSIADRLVELKKEFDL